MLTYPLLYLQESKDDLTPYFFCLLMSPLKRTVLRCVFLDM